MNRRKSLRSAFVTTASTAAAVATMALAGGCFTVDNGLFAGECPTEMPAAGSACADDGRVCTFSSCGAPDTATCSDGRWILHYEECGNPPPPDDCPAVQPGFGELCFTVGLTCGYGVDECGEPLNSICGDTGWESNGGSCNPPPPCPLEMPRLGSECETTPGGGAFGCQYNEETPCGIEPVALGCMYNEVSGTVAWAYEVPPTCEVTPAQCQEYKHSAGCEADSGCSWRTPGCADPMGAPNLAEAGCFPTEDCTTGTEGCGNWGTCTLVTHNPCWNSLCDACGGELNVCIPNPQP